MVSLTTKVDVEANAFSKSAEAAIKAAGGNAVQNFDSMKKSNETLKNIWKIEDLRQRILITILFVAIYRLGSFVVLPGIDPSQLTALRTQTEGWIDVFAEYVLWRCIF